MLQTIGVAAVYLVVHLTAYLLVFRNLRAFTNEGTIFLYHLVSAVVTAAELPAEAGRFAAQIALAPRDVLVRTKAKALRRSGITAGATLDL